MKNQSYLLTYCKPLLFCLFFFAFVTLSSQNTYNINDPKDLESQTYQPGDEIVLTNGIYTSDERIDFVGNGTAAEPIIFRAETPGGVKFTGGLQMNIGGDHVVVDGFHWQGGFGASNFIQFRNGTDYANHSTIQNCVIDGLAIHPDDVRDDSLNNSITKHRWIVLYGTYNTVINCSFLNKKSAGALILAEYYYNANTPCAIVGHTISNNYFYKYEKIDNTLSNSGDSETIRIGSSGSQHVPSNAVVQNNYFVEADGENEIITNKSKGNQYTNNTFRRCRGSLVLRHGSAAMVDGNYFLGENVEGTGGIRITDSDHTIRNNYIQDCINIASQAKWNNGITFIGGGDNAAVPCTSTNMTNGYQKSENINLSNNSIVNTNAPLFYNTDKGSTDPTGNVSDNLIYFASGSPNVSDILSGDTPTSYANLGTALNYSGNVYNGATLGATNNGFSLESGITATADGEIFTFSGAGSTAKGADMGNYTPIADSMVGYGIGACFVNHLGASITNGNCTIANNDFLTVGNLPPFGAQADTNTIAVTSNVSWTVSSDATWLTVDSNAGSGNASLSVFVTQNNDRSSRVGTITITQDPGGDDIIRSVTVTQEAPDLTDLYTLINTGTGSPGDRVVVHSFSKEEVNGTNKFNYASNTLDKDNGTVWAADDGAILAGDFKGDGEYIIYDLDSIYELRLIQYTTTNKADPFGFEIWVSTTGTNPSDFSKVLPISGDLLYTATNTTDFNQYELNTATDARYVKLMGYGRFDTTANLRTSVWSAIGEIEFYGNGAVSLAEIEFEKQFRLYPIPSNNCLQLEHIDGIQSIAIYSIEGKKLSEKTVTSTSSKTSIDVSSLSNGYYFILLKGEQLYLTRQFIISR